MLPYQTWTRSSIIITLSRVHVHGFVVNVNTMLPRYRHCSSSTNTNTTVCYCTLQSVVRGQVAALVPIT